jgi:hypothetical protein
MACEGINAMLLLETALIGKLTSGTPLTDETRYYLASAALDCLAISGGAFFSSSDPESSQQVIAALSQDINKVSSILGQRQENLYSWITHLLSAIQSLQYVIESYKIERRIDAVPATEDLIQLILHAAKLNLLALNNRDYAAAIVITQMDAWLRNHASFGVVHYSILARACARQIFGKGHNLPPSEAAKFYEDRAYELLDRADEINQTHNNSEYYSDILIAAHQTLPLYGTSLRLFGWAKELYQSVNIDVTEDLIKEIGVTEECRVACIETLSTAGVFQIDQVLNTASLNIQLGKPLSSALQKSTHDACARIPHYPVRLRKAWHQLIERVDAVCYFPSAQHQQLRLFAMLAYIMQERMKEIFTDVYVVEAAVAHQRRSGFPLYQSYYTPPPNQVDDIYSLLLEFSTIT